jgi:hypothetical protein
MESPESVTTKIKIVDVTPDSTRTEETDSENEIPSIETGKNNRKKWLEFKTTKKALHNLFSLFYLLLPHAGGAMDDAKP